MLHSFLVDEFQIVVQKNESFRFYEIMTKFFRFYQCASIEKNKNNAINIQINLIYLLYSFLNANYFKVFQCSNPNKEKYRLLLSELSEEYLYHINSHISNPSLTINPNLVITQIQTFHELFSNHYKKIQNSLELLFCHDITYAIMEYL